MHIETKKYTNITYDETPKYIETGLKRKDGTQIKCFNYKYELENKQKIFLLKEDKTKYIITNENEIRNTSKKHQVHDKLFKDIFSDKNEAVKFINKYLNLQIPLKQEQIEAYSTEFITEEYYKENADIVYKIKDKDIFFLIEHQSKIDRTMPFRINEYASLIIRKAIDKSRMRQKDYKFPLVIKIVLYTGHKKWNAELELKNIQEVLPGYKPSLEDYNIIDVNNYRDEDLLNDNLLVSKGMYVETIKNKQEVVQKLEKMIKSVKEQDIPGGARFIEVIEKYVLEIKNRKLNLDEEKEGGKIRMSFLELLQEYQEDLYNDTQKMKKMKIKLANKSVELENKSIEIARKSKEVAKKSEEVAKKSEEVEKKSEEVEKKFEEVERKSKKIEKDKRKIELDKEKIAKAMKNIANHKENISKDKENIIREREKLTREKSNIIKKEENAIKVLIKCGLSSDEISELIQVSKLKVENIRKKYNKM